MGRRHGLEGVEGKECLILMRIGTVADRARYDVMARLINLKAECLRHTSLFDLSIGQPAVYLMYSHNPLDDEAGFWIELGIWGGIGGSEQILEARSVERTCLTPSPRKHLFVPAW